MHIRKVMGSLLSPVRRLLLEPFKRASDPEPEASNSRQQHVLAKRFASINWVWLPLLAVLGALGLLVIAYAYGHTRNEGTARLRTYFYPGIILLFAPTAIRLLTPSVSRAERIILVCIGGMFCYLIKPLTSPLHFYLYDEFLHWLTGNDITASTHFFTPNPLLPVSPYYPGLEIVTSAFRMLSGLDSFNTSLILIGVARLMMTLTLFALNEELFQSARTASIATLLYMINPHYIFFDTQYAYESLALPLALVVLFIMTPYQAMCIQLTRLNALSSSKISLFASSTVRVKTDLKKLRGERRAMSVMALIVLSAVVFTHHATDFFFIALLILWAVIFSFLRLVPIYRSHLLWLAIAGIVLSIAWINAPNNPVVPYLVGFLSSVFNHTGKHFTPIAVNGYSALPWEKNLGQYGTYFTMACIPLGLFCCWQRYRSHALAWMLSITALGLIGTLPLKTSDNGIQLADRASAVLYIPVGSVLAVFIVQFWPIRKLNWIHISLITSVMTALFMAGYILSGGSGYGSPPTPYVVGADSRSIEIDGIQAATWAYTYLGPHKRVGTDRTNQLLMATFGDQRIVVSIADHVDIAPIFFALTLDSDTLTLMKQSRLSYLVIDERMSRAPPVVGSYIEKIEPGAFQHYTPVSLQALTKFDTIPKINKLFDDGSIVIYDVRGLTHAY